MPETISIALPRTVVDRGTQISLSSLRSSVLYQCILLGLRSRAFDFLCHIPRAGRTEVAWTVEVVQATFDSVRLPMAGAINDPFTVTVHRYIEGVDVYEGADAVAPLDLASVSPKMCQILLTDGFRCFTAKTLSSRLLADPFVLPGDEP